MYCRNCGKELDDQAVACTGCGVPPLKGCRYCQKCGKEVDQAAVVCVSCGAQLATASAFGAADDKTWAMLSHILMIVTGFVGPLIIFLTKGKESEFVKDQAAEALNFAITVFIASVGLYVASIALSSILWVFGLIFGLVTWVPGVAALVFGIMGAMQANSGVRYRYPFSLKLFK